MGLSSFTTRQLSVAFSLLLLGPLEASALVSNASASDANPQARAMTLLQESLLWIRHHDTATDPGTTAGEAVLLSESAGGVPGPSAIPISSVAARDHWIGQNFYLRGEDHEAAQTDRVRVGFETDGIRVPGSRQNLSVDYNWSTSQQPGDTTMDMGLAWQMPLGDNLLAFRGRFHEYEDEVDGGDVKRVSGTRQTLELDLARTLYQGDHGGLDARVITTDVSHRWYQNGDLTNKARRSYSLLRLDGHVDSYLPVLDAYGNLGLAIEGCVALTEGADQESCGEKLGAFQRYNLSASLQRQWLNMDWGLRGEYQFTPDELPSWRYMEVGPGMIHGFGGQVMRGREGGWLRLDTQTHRRLLWSPFKVYTNLRFSFLRGWTEAASTPYLTSRASVAEVLWQVSGENLTGGVRAGTLVDSTGPGIAATHVPDISVNLSWSL